MTSVEGARVKKNTRANVRAAVAKCGGLRDAVSAGEAWGVGQDRLASREGV